MNKLIHMRILCFLILSANIFSNEIHGELLNFDDEVIGNCTVSELLMKNDRATIDKLKFLDRTIENIKFRYMVKNAIGGDLYISKNRIGFVLNTDIEQNLIQIKFSSKDLFLTCNF